MTDICTQRSTPETQATIISRPIWGFLIETFTVSIYAELRGRGLLGLKPLISTKGRGYTEFDFGGIYIVTATKDRTGGFNAPLR